MLRTMPSAEELSRLVTPDILAAQGFKKPKKVVVTEGTDSTGDEAYYVWIVYPDSTPQKELSLRNTSPLQNWIREQISGVAGEDRYVYVMIKQVSHAPSYI
jgi:hypothetical protein